MASSASSAGAGREGWMMTLKKKKEMEGKEKKEHADRQMSVWVDLFELK